MTTQWTFRRAQVWAALFTASGPEDYAEYADCDADPCRVRREPAADLVAAWPINDHSGDDMNFALLASFRQRRKRWLSGWRK